MVVVKYKGTKKTENFLNRILQRTYLDLEKYGEQGVAALAAATPVDTGKTAASWSYEITHDKDSWTLAFCNSNIVEGVPIAIILQYGHGTGNGGYVQGRDYINPAIQPVFDRLADEAWKEVTK